MRTTGLLRFPGSKSLAADFILKRFPDEIVDRFVEPFAGNFTIGLAAKQATKARRFFLNDFDENLICFHRTVHKNNDDLVKMLYSLVGLNLTTKENLFYEYQESLKSNIVNEHFQDNVTLAAEYFFVNRCSYNGGGIYAGFSKHAAVQRFTKSSIDKIAKYKDLYKDLFITNWDYRFVLKTHKMYENTTLYYCDPPYLLPDGRNSLYKDHKNFNHEGLAKALHESTAKVLLSYNDCDIIREYYKDWTIEEVEFPYSMGPNKTGKELLIRNY
jgi:DNA adenine methylase